MKFFIRQGYVYKQTRNDIQPYKRLSPQKLTPTDRYYLRKSTTYTDKSWIFFSQIENDFRLLNKPYSLTN